ncbi:MAG: hypothetical protein ABIJ34_09105 [archaeon]
MAAKLDDDTLVSRALVSLVHDGDNKTPEILLAIPSLLSQSEDRKARLIRAIRKQLPESHNNYLDLTLTLVQSDQFPVEYRPVDELGSCLRVPNNSSGPFPPSIYHLLMESILVRGKDESLSAQGVNWRKGGIVSLLNIMLEGEIRHGNFGQLIKGNSKYCAGSHGPYFVILDDNRESITLKHYANSYTMHAPESTHLAYLVPPDNAELRFLSSDLNAAIGLGIITTEEATLVMAKIVTHSQFLDTTYTPKGIFGSSDPLAFASLHMDEALACLRDLSVI